MKKICIVVLVLILVLTMATACNKTTGETASSPDTEKATQNAETTAETTEKTEATDTEATEGRLARTPAYEGERPTLTVTWNAPWFTHKAEYWPVDTLTALCEYTNLDLEFYVWETGDQMALDIASGDLTDIIEVPGNYVPQLLDANLMVAMDDYVDSYAPLLRSVSPLREAVMRDSYSNGDGHWYFFTPNVGLDVPVFDWFVRAGYKVRWDAYVEQGYPEIKTVDDYIDYIKTAAEAHPETEDGLPTYGYGLWVSEDLYPFWVSGGIYGYVNYSGNMFYDTDDPSVIINAWTDEEGPIWRWIDFCYKLNQEGLFDPDSFTMTSEDVNVKINNGQYFSTHNNANLYELERAEDPDTIVGWMDIPVEGTAVWGNMINNVGPGFFYGITTNCKNVEAAMTYFNFMNGEDANRLMMTGEQGVMWDYDADGNPAILQSAIDLKSELTGDEYSKAFNTLWNCTSGISNSQPLSDGGIGNLWGDPVMKAISLNPLQEAYCEHFGISYPQEIFVNMIEEGKCWDASRIYYDAGALIGTTPDEISLCDTAVRQILVRSIPDLILAKDQADFDAVKAQVLADMEAAGVKKADDWYQTKFQEAIEYIDAATGN